MTAPSLTSWLAGARETIAKATPGKWASGGDEVYSAKPYHVVCRMCDDVPLDNDNSDAIVLAVNALPALLEVVEAAANAREAQAAYHRAKHVGFETEKEARAAWSDADLALDAALLALTEVPRG